MNFRNLGLICLALLVSASGLMADTIPGGDVSGTWYQSHSPYYIAGNITVPVNDTLFIEPGVEVNFLGYYSFGVSGLLHAAGTETDSIRFTAGTDWFGLTIAYAPDSSRLEYCVLEADNAFLGLVYCSSSNPVISHCRISNNTSYEQSGGVSLVNSNARISHCTIAGNTGTSGGGVKCVQAAPRISHCTITGNTTASRGGGISVETGSNPVIDSCVIRGNRARQGGGIAVTDTAGCTISGCVISADTAWGDAINSHGGGIYVNSPGASVTITGSEIDSCIAQRYGGGVFIQSAASVTLERSVIDGNRSNDLGGAINVHHCNLLVDHCDVVKNKAELVVNGILLDTASTLTLTNSIFRGQDGYDIYFRADSSASVSYSDFYDSVGSPFGGSPPAGLGELVQTNANGDSCDIYYNILLDPMFADFPNRNYNLTDSSPCIDAGDPLSPYDPDSTLPDMGTLFFYQTGQAEQNRPQVTASRPGPTIGRGVLNLGVGSRQNAENRADLLDACGRKVMDLHPGENDVRALAPGVYFVERGSSLEPRSRVVIAK